MKLTSLGWDRISCTQSIPDCNLFDLTWNPQCLCLPYIPVLSYYYTQMFCFLISGFNLNLSPCINTTTSCPVLGSGGQTIVLPNLSNILLCYLKTGSLFPFHLPFCGLNIPRSFKFLLTRIPECPATTERELTIQEGNKLEAVNYQESLVHLAGSNTLGVTVKILSKMLITGRALQRGRNKQVDKLVKKSKLPESKIFSTIEAAHHL